MAITKRQLCEMIESYPEDSPLQFELDSDYYEGDLLDLAVDEHHSWIEGIVLKIGSSDNRNREPELTAPTRLDIINERPSE